MQPRRCLSLVLAVVLMFATTPHNARTGPAIARADGGPKIRLQRTTFAPLAEQPSFQPELMASALAAVGGRYRLVQFQGPILPEWKQAASQAGAELLDYVPDYAFVARLQPGAEPTLRALPCVRWVGPYHPAYKISTALDDTLGRPEESGALDLRVRVFQGEDLAVAERALDGLGAKVSERAPSSWGGSLRLNLPARALPSAAQVPAVAWVEPVYPFELANNVGRGIMGVNTAWERLPGLYGGGQTVAVADTGLDTGDPAALSTDFAERVVQHYALGRPGDWSDDEGHGTHVAGSVVGNGSLSGSDPAAHDYTESFAGVAPEADLVVQSVGDSEGGLDGIPLDLNYLFQPTYDDGARIHTNSWGAPGTDGLYNTDSRNADEFSWDHKAMTLLFAAGNEGVDANSDGIVDADSIDAPGTAKNVITVGASESFGTSGGYKFDPPHYNYTWGTCWPDEYAALPISADPLSNHVDGLAAFSSRGPTDDGRIKPDLVAPGTNIISARSHDADAGIGWGVYDADHVYMGGTSMATPLTAGAAALVRDWYNDQKGVANPSGALIKATLINGATTIAPGQYGTGATQEVPNATPNNVTGWGRVNLAGSVVPDAPIQIWHEDHTAGLTTSNQTTYWFSTSDSLVASTEREGAGELLFDPPLMEPPPASQGVEPRTPPEPFTMPEHIELADGGAPVPAGMAATGMEMVLNGGFETGDLSPWYALGQPSVTSAQHNGGSYCAELTNDNNQDGVIRQALSFPTGIVSATLSFWLRIDTEEIEAGYDSFWLAFYRVSDGQLVVPLGYLDATMASAGWAQVTYPFDGNAIEAVEGQSLYLAFSAQTDTMYPTWCYVDDVSVEYDTTLPGGRRPFRATLAWTDYPAGELAAQTLVNDLDLEVVAPGGTRYYGNNASAASRDRKNNVETVWLADDAPAGTWSIIVKAANVPQSTQPYALVVSGSDLAETEPEWTSFIFLPLVLRP